MNGRNPRPRFSGSERAGVVNGQSPGRGFSAKRRGEVDEDPLRGAIAPSAENLPLQRLFIARAVRQPAAGGRTEHATGEGDTACNRLGVALNGRSRVRRGDHMDGNSNAYRHAQGILRTMKGPVALAISSGSRFHISMAMLKRVFVDP